MTMTLCIACKQCKTHHCYLSSLREGTSVEVRSEKVCSVPICAIYSERLAIKAKVLHDGCAKLEVVIPVVRQSR